MVLAVEELFDLPPDHQRDHFARLDVVAGESADMTTIAEHFDAICQTHNFPQVMRYVEDGGSGVAEPFDQG